MKGGFPLAKFKRNTSNKQVNQPRKPKLTSKANLYYRDQIAPLEKKYRQAMQSKNYKHARELFNQIRNLKKEYLLLLHRKERVKIN